MLGNDHVTCSPTVTRRVAGRNARTATRPSATLLSPARNCTAAGGVVDAARVAAPADPIDTTPTAEAAVETANTVVATIDRRHLV